MKISLWAAARHAFVLAVAYGAASWNSSADADADAPQNRKKSTAPLVALAYPTTAELLTHLSSADPELHARLTADQGPLTQEIERRAVAFANDNHPELARVLTKLGKRRRKAAFHRAIRDVVRDSKRIEQHRKRNPKGHRAALEAWRQRSRIRMLAARIALSGDTADASSATQIEQLVRKLHNTRRESNKRRIQRIESQLQQLRERVQEDPEVAIQRELAAIRSKIQRRRQR